VEMGSNRAMVLGELWKRVRDHPLRDKLLTGRYEKTLGDRDAKYFADGLERPKRGHRIAFGWDPVKGWGASSAKDKERKRKGSSAADRRGKKARASGAAAGLPPPPAHPPPALSSTEKSTQTSVNPGYMQALLTDVFTDNIEAVSRAVDLAKKKDLYVRTYDSSDSDADEFVQYEDNNPTGAGRLWLFEMVPEEMRKNPKVLSLFMDDEEHVPAVTRYMSQAQRCDVNWAEALIYQHKNWSPYTFFNDSVSNHPRIVVANLRIETGFEEPFYGHCEHKHMRTRPDQVACAIYAILYHQCDIDEMTDSKPALEIVGGMELDSSQVAKMFWILKQMFATTPSDEISYGMAGLRGSPKLTVEDVLQVKDAMVELLRSVDSDDSSDDDDSSNIISLDDSDEEVVPVHKSDWIMTTERGTTTVETVEAGYREYQARVE
jgi:hypothetical protein